MFIFLPITNYTHYAEILINGAHVELSLEIRHFEIVSSIYVKSILN